jgi:hypothetical protein
LCFLICVAATIPIAEDASLFQHMGEQSFCRRFLFGEESAKLFFGQTGVQRNVMQHFSGFPLIDRCAVFQYNHHPYCALRTHKDVLGTVGSIATGR